MCDFLGSVLKIVQITPRYKYIKHYKFLYIRLICRDPDPKCPEDQETLSRNDVSENFPEFSQAQPRASTQGPSATFPI